MISEKLAIIQKGLRNLSNLGLVSVMPDYFVDRLVRFESLDSLITEVRKKSSESGGGSVRGIRQKEVKGGNAVNLAYALGTFGASVHLTAIANSLPAEILKITFNKFENVSLEIFPGVAGYTTAFEFREKDHHVNVMMSDVGDLKTFDGSRLGKVSLGNIKKSKMVAIVNWSANRSGNELCERIFSLAKKKGGKTFFDPADISGQRDLLPDLKKRLFDRNLIDYISLNENEARIMSGELFNHDLPINFKDSDLIKTARILSEGTGATVDLHTRTVTVSSTGSQTIGFPCHKVEQRTVTGAGDVWGAANIACYLAGLDPEDRLYFANSAAGLYVSRESADAPSLKEVFEFMKERPFIEAL